MKAKPPIKAGKHPNGKKQCPSPWKKVALIFDELRGPIETRRNKNGPDSRSTIARALTKRYGKKKADEIAFHLYDWSEDAKFLVAVLLFCDHFTLREIECGITQLLIHAPNHLAAAATLAGWPIGDTFGVGIRVVPVRRNKKTG